MFQSKKQEITLTEKKKIMNKSLVLLLKVRKLFILHYKLTMHTIAAVIVTMGTSFGVV